MKRTRLNRIGATGRANIEARKQIAVIAEEMGLTHCELRLEGCLGTFPLAPAHRHKRAWYRGEVEQLADVRQWVAACQSCHDHIEHDQELTEACFLDLRGAE